ncbi:FLYWCH zinc finger domain-containing protein [Phthorimaea operculella]|nr:FLYWCH zinc finger domain-containing protein [Phthorimaea operculella]
MFGKSRCGMPVLLLGSNRFNRNLNFKGEKVRWYCVKRRGGCRALVHTILDTIVRTFTETDPDQTFLYRNPSVFTVFNCMDLSGTPVEYERSNCGNKMVSVGRYRYSLHSNYKLGQKKLRWVCGLSGRRGCKAIIFTEDDVIVWSKNGHNH